MLRCLLVPGNVSVQPPALVARRWLVPPNVVGAIGMRLQHGTPERLPTWYSNNHSIAALVARCNRREIPCAQQDRLHLSGSCNVSSLRLQRMRQLLPASQDSYQTLGIELNQLGGRFSRVHARCAESPKHGLGSRRRADGLARYCCNGLTVPVQVRRWRPEP